MCGRFTLTIQKLEDLALKLGVPALDAPRHLYRPRYNIAPTDPHLIVRMRLEERELQPANWGLINTWAKDAKRAAMQINARAETLATLPPFREAFKKRRCVVPADGFFEWLGSKQARQPVWFHREDGEPILFAGLYESWQPKPGEWQRTFTIVTTTPNLVTAPVHNRMPVILLGDAIDEWLDPRNEDLEGLARLLAPAPDDLLIPTLVSPRVNSVKNDDPACLEPVEAQPGLF